MKKGEYKNLVKIEREFYNQKVLTVEEEKLLNRRKYNIIFENKRKANSY